MAWTAKRRAPPARRRVAAKQNGKATAEERAPVEVTNAQVGDALRTAARSLGLTFEGLARLIVANLQRAKLIDAEGDGGISLRVFDLECSRKRRERERRRAEEENLRRLDAIGHEAVPATEREDGHVDPNPDALVINAMALLERRDKTRPGNWAAMVAGALGLLRQALGDELARPIASREQLAERRATLRVVAAEVQDGRSFGDDEDGPEGFEGLE